MLITKSITQLLIMMVLISIPTSIICASELNLSSAAKNVVKEVGTVGKVRDGDTLSQVFIVERVPHISCWPDPNSYHAKPSLHPIRLKTYWP